MKKIVRRFASALLISLLTLTPAFAEILFTRQEHYANTALGIIAGTNDPVSPLVSNIGGNNGQGIFPFLNSEGKSRVAVSLFTMPKSTVINIYAPGDRANWAKGSTWVPIKELSATDIANPRAMTTLGGALYGSAYDNGKIVRLNAKGDDYTQTASYTFTPAPGGYVGHAEGLLSYKDSLYALFSQSKGDYPNMSYLSNKLVKLDKNLKVVDSTYLIGKNTDGGTPGAYLLKDNVLLVTSMGGNQPDNGALNPESRIEAVNLDDMKATQLVVAQKVQEGDPTFSHMFVAVAATRDKLYAQAVQWKPSWAGYNIRVYETTLDKLVKGDLGTLAKTFDGATGYKTGLAYDADSGLLWAAAGESLWRYDGKTWKEFDKNALKGDIVAFAVLTPTKIPEIPNPILPPQEKKDSGGGCDAGFTALFLLAVLPLALKKKTS